nr:PREDICTED: heme oxygenase [Linepithema humile]
MPDEAEENFCKKMANATKLIHHRSDGLVKSKLFFGAFNDAVWADGLLVFYEIFRYLDGAMIRLRNTKIGLLPFSELQRTEAFERDLDHYLGKEWRKNYTPRESVAKYLMRLREVEDTDPTLLMAYIYHLYMGLLSGGIILRKKRELAKRIAPFIDESSSKGHDVTDFGQSSISQLKQDLRESMNRIAETLDEDTKNKLIEESKIVFELNNEIIKSIQTGHHTLEKIFALINRCTTIVVLVSILIIALYFLFNPFATTVPAAL